MTRLGGKVVLITGGGSGIGRATALRCGADGARIAVLDRDLDAAERTAQQIGAAGSAAVAVELDVSEPDAVARAVAMSRDALGGLDGLFNNAAVVLRPGDGTLTELQWSAWDRTLAINLTGAALMMRHALTYMMRQGSGAIVNNISVAALVAEDGIDAYTAAKGGLLALTRSVASSYAAYGVRCNAVCPGLVETGMAQMIHDDSARRLREETILPIPGPEAIAPLVSFLLSDDAGYVTGSTHVVDGGYTVR